MSLATQSLYEAAKRELGAGIGGSTFDSCFINAVNCALDQMSDEADLSSRHSHITTVNATITTLGTGHWYILYAGTIFFLIRMGQRPSDPKMAGIVYQSSEKQWSDAMGNYLTRIINDYQATATNSVFKLGYVSC